MNDTTTPELRATVPLWRVAYVRDDSALHTGEALLLACLMHTKGRGRNSRDMADLQDIMRDQNR